MDDQSNVIKSTLNCYYSLLMNSELPTSPSGSSRFQYGDRRREDPHTQRTKTIAHSFRLNFKFHSYMDVDWSKLFFRGLLNTCSPNKSQILAQHFREL